MQATIEKEFTIHFPKKNKSYFEGWYIRVHTSTKILLIFFQEYLLVKIKEHLFNTLILNIVKYMTFHGKNFLFI